MICSKLLDILVNHGKRIYVLASEETQSSYQQFFSANEFSVLNDNQLKNGEFYDIMFIADHMFDRGLLNYLEIWNTAISIVPNLADELTKISDAHYFDSESEQLFRLNQEIPVCYKGEEYVNQLNYFYNLIRDFFPELEEFKNDYGIIYAGATTGIHLWGREISDIIREIKYNFARGAKKIIFWNGEETIQYGSLLRVQRAVDILKDYAPQHTFFYVSSGLDITSTYEKLKKTLGFSNHMKMLCINRFQKKALHDYNNYSPELKECLNKPYSPKLRLKKFLCFNRVNRLHRTLLIANLIERGLIQESYTSYDTDNRSVDQLLNTVTFEKEAAIMSSSLNMFPLVLNRTPERDNPTYLNLDDMKYFDQSYFSVVTETSYHHDVDSLGNFFSEKIFKPIIAKHPFIVVSTPGFLTRLRENGFQTFGHVINEHYDTIQDDTQRMHAIVDEIERLSKLSDQEILDWQRAVKPTVEHNFYTMINKTDLDHRITADIRHYL